MPVKPDEELLKLESRSTEPFVEAINGLGRAMFDNNDADRRKWIDRLRSVFGDTMIIADLMGRRRMLLELDAAGEEVEAFKDVTILPEAKVVTFEDAIANLLGREPRLAGKVESVVDAYRGRNEFALARNSENQVIRRVRDIIAKTAGVKGPKIKPIEAIQQIGGFSRAYAETVFRTNINRAYNAGRVQQAREPEIAEFVPALEYMAVLDSDVRDNHKANDGIVAFQDDPIWDVITPPNGFNCRCTVRLVTSAEMKRRFGEQPPPRGQLTAENMPDPGFGVRPDAGVY